MTPHPTTEAFLPLKPVILQILLTFRDSDLHGYEILRRMAEASDGIFRIDPGTLYRHLARLLGRNLIEETTPSSTPEPDHRKRRHYRLTPLGRAVLQAEIERLESVVAIARQWANG